MSELRHVARAEADAATIWRILTDHAGMAGWLSQVFRSRLARPGMPTANGVGAIRRVLSLAGPVSEEVTTFDEPLRLEYRMTAGPPIVTNYRGTVTLVPDAGETVINWVIRFDPRPAWLTPVVETIARLSTSRFAADLAKAADRAA